MTPPAPDPGSRTGRADEQPFVIIIGEAVALGPLRRDLPYQRWFSAFETTRTVGTSRPMTVEEATVWYERHATNEREAHFALYERATWRPIGTTMWTWPHEGGSSAGSVKEGHYPPAASS